MSDVKVSIIVPVGDPGQYISRCIDSLIRQTLKDIEIIFIDDCGTDGSINQVHLAADQDNRIRILKNEKRIGPGSSRNKGILFAKGEYLSFIDADDFIEYDFLELLYNKAKENHSDIAKGVIDYYLCDGKYEAFIESSNHNQAIQKGIKEHAPLYTSFTYHHFSAIYLSSLIKKFNICYGETPVFEESLFLLRIFTHTRSISIVPKARYHYVQRKDSISSGMNELFLSEYAKAFDVLMKTLAENYTPDQYAIDYAANKINFAVYQHFRAGLIPGLEGAAAKYLITIRNTVLHIPFFKEMTEKYPVIRVLTECETALPLNYPIGIKEYFSGFFYGNLFITRWTDFFIQHPDYFPICEEQFLSTLWKRPVRFTKTLKRKKGIPLVFYPSVQKVLRSLPIKDYLRVNYKLIFHYIPVRLRKKIMNKFREHTNANQ